MFMSEVPLYPQRGLQGNFLNIPDVENPYALRRYLAYMKTLPARPYRRPMPRVLVWSKEFGRFFTSEVTPANKKNGHHIGIKFSKVVE